MRSLFSTLCLLISLPLLAGEAEIGAALAALQSPDSVLIDVRSAEEFAAGALPGAEQIEPEQIASRIGAIAPDKAAPIILYCQSGRRSGIAEENLRAMGYSNLINAGSYEDLKHALESQD